MKSLNTARGNYDPIASVFSDYTLGYAIVEFKTPEEATVALAFDGISFQETLPLTLTRPSNYIAPFGQDHDQKETPANTIVPDSSDKIVISGLPENLTDELVRELWKLLEAFGHLYSFVLVKDKQTETSKGIAFCVFAETDRTSMAIEGLNGMEFGEKVLKVALACQGHDLDKFDGAGALGTIKQLFNKGKPGPEDRVIMLFNMLVAEDLLDGKDFDEICEEVRRECEKFGQVQDLKIPRPITSKPNPGVGKVFVKFYSEKCAKDALLSIAGRRFADRLFSVHSIPKNRLMSMHGKIEWIPEISDSKTRQFKRKPQCNWDYRLVTNQEQ